MSEPGVFVFVRNGEKEVFADRWGGLMLHREILWGPDALEEFASHFQSVPVEELEYSEQGVVVDFDHRKLYYSADYEKLRIPVVQAAYNKLLAISWPGYELVLQPNGVEVRDDIDAPDHQDVPFADRNETVDESGRVDLGEDEDDSEDATFSDDELVAWVTIISRNANVRHRLLEDLPQEFFKPEKGLAKRIGLLEPAQVPSEKAVFEGAVIDIPNRTLSMWGSKEIQSNLAQIDKRWGDWKVNWLSNGYAAHCELTASLGKFTSEAEAAAQFMPMALTTKRLDMSTFIGAMGGGLKKNAIKVTGCLYFLVCIPILIFAFFSGMWTAALITILVTLVVFVIAFKLLESKIKKKFSPISDKAKNESDPDVPTAAGPLDRLARETQLGEMLERAGLPSMAEVKTHIGEDDELDFLE